MALEMRFCKSRRRSLRSERTVNEEATKVDSRPLSRATGSNSRCSWPEQLLDAEARPLRLHRAGVEARDVEQRRQDFLDRVEGGVDVFGEGGIALVAVALDEGSRIEARRVERLEDVVARRGEEARLRDVRLVGLGLGTGELLVQSRQFLGALADALLQGLVRAPAFLLRGDGVGDVRVGRDEAAVGELVRADLDGVARRDEA